MKAQEDAPLVGGVSPEKTDVREVAPGVFRVCDTCEVYVVRAGPEGSSGIAIDFGSGLVLHELERMGVSRLTHVLLTHHHRDQAQGLDRAAAAGAEIWVPPVERDLFDDVETFWASRQVRNDYDLLSDRFSLLHSVPVDGTVPEYRTRDFGGVAVTTVPTPGHTPGSVSYLVERADERLAFTGDLIFAPGKVWSLAATQWTYTGNEGPAMTMVSALVLASYGPSLLLPSHGKPMPDPAAALTLLVDNLHSYVASRLKASSLDVRQLLDDPFVKVTDHLLRNTSSEASSYVLLSTSGAALLIDYGYDMTTWTPLGGPRWSQRPLLASLPALRQHYGVTRVEVMLATHYHDDHVAGASLLREVEGTEIWLPDNVAPILARPMQYDLPCQWFDPIIADRVLSLGAPFTWQEYTITPHEQRGHTRYAAAYELEVDGQRVLAVGDQLDGVAEGGMRRDIFNYQYRNEFGYHDFQRSAEMYQRVAPGLLIAGHRPPQPVDTELLDSLSRSGDLLVTLHEQLLPLDELALPASGVLARLAPYEREARPGQTLRYGVEVINPLSSPVTARVTLVVPEGWQQPAPLMLPLDGLAKGTAELDVTIGDEGPGQRTRFVVAADVEIGAITLGQHAEALVNVSGGSR